MATTTAADMTLSHDKDKTAKSDQPERRVSFAERRANKTPYTGTERRKATSEQRKSGPKSESKQKPRSGTDRRQGAERRAPEPTAYTPEKRTATTERRFQVPSFSNVGIERRLSVSARRKS